MAETTSSKTRKEWPALRGELEGGTANMYRRVKVCRNCFGMYGLLDAARELLGSDARVEKRMQQAAQAILPAPAVVQRDAPLDDQKIVEELIAIIVKMRARTSSAARLPLQLWRAEHFRGVADDAFYEREVQMLELAFEGQMHFGIYYAYVKLKEQEIRNLVWISECIVQQQKDEINKFVPCFSSTAPWRAS